MDSSFGDTAKRKRLKKDDWAHSIKADSQGCNRGKHA